jgi:hypothetical protein
MSNLIQIKRSPTSGAPGSLNPGELAYSNTAQVIYIGSTDGLSVVPIGGARNPGVLTANQALVANSSSAINSIQHGNTIFVGTSQNININGSVGTAGQLLLSNASANAYWGLPGSNTYIQFNDSGSLNAVSGFTFAKTTNTLTVGTGFTANNTLANAAALSTVGNTTVGGTLIVSTGLTSNSTLTNVASLGVVGNATVGGNLVVTGNAYVAGNTFLVNATAITTNDLALYLANNQGTSLLTNGAGFYVGNSAAPIASFLYNNATTSLQSNVNLSVSLGTSNALLNSTYLQVGNSTVNATVNTTGFFVNGNALYTNASNIITGTLPYAQLGPNVVNTTANFTVSGNLNFTGTNNYFSSIVYVGANVYANTTTIQIGNSTVNTTINATSFSGTANNATYFNGTALSTVQGWITGNAATAYTNATTFSANASNINNGTLSYLYGGTSQNTYSLGDILVGNATNGISRLAVGTNGYVLQSNGTTLVYNTLDGGSF